MIAQQLRGLEELTARGVQVKINSVLIPGVNDAHLPEVSRVVREKGAILHNVMPLIARAEHGTHYGLTGQREPTAEELAATRAACESSSTMMSHCQQCRADATGMLGDGSRRRIQPGQGRGDDGGPASGHGQAGRGAGGHRAPTG
ncbi:MAG: hypothetical protein U5O69_02265 [Candidatus Competibacteraceae bacterium]|nr:hypothetical protein [Candidatus Competibacteraceae bacterium]